jgi:hypothetical protein
MSRSRKGNKREKSHGRYVQLREWLLACPAWQSLDGNCRALYIEIARRYRGPNSNNGKIPFSVREAATMLHVGTNTAARCLDVLQERGFTKIAKDGGFNVKGRIAREWLLTEFPDDTSGITNEASKDFMRWSEPHQNSFHSAITDTYSAITDTVKAGKPAPVVKKSRLRICNRTVKAAKVVPQCDYRDTIQTARWLRPEEQVLQCKMDAAPVGITLPSSTTVLS